MSTENLKKTALNETHRALGGKMVEYGGWEMPVQYPAGVIAEHLGTRTHAGLFDVSHMGEIWVEGEDAIKFVNRITTNDVTKLVDGQAHYSCLPNETGGVVDDLLVYRFYHDKLLLVVNASTTDKDWAWITSHEADEAVTLTNASADYCQIAVQGPEALEILKKLTDINLNEIKYYHFTVDKVDGIEAIISRTGYTGEDGFEVYADAEHAERLWNKLLEAGHYGEADGIIPCGLAARNTLRLESAMSLYGNELDDTISPLEANLGWICKINKGDFIGREHLVKLKEDGLERRIVGFEMTAPGIARDHYDVYINDQKAGYVTSGSPAPFLKKNIGLAFVPVEFAKIGQEITIDIRSKKIPAVIVPTPFYKREKA